MPPEGDSPREESHDHDSIAVPSPPQAQEHDADILCNLCAQVDWSTLATNGLIRSGETHQKLRPLNETFEELRNSDCRLCRIVALIKPASLDGIPCFLTAFTISFALHDGDAWMSLYSGSSEDAILGIWEEYQPLNSPYNHRYLGVTKPKDETYDWEAIKIHPNSIDFTTLKELTKLCAENHTSCGLPARPLDTVPGLKVIDITKHPPEITCISAPDERESE